MHMGISHSAIDVLISPSRCSAIASLNENSGIENAIIMARNAPVASLTSFLTPAMPPVT